MDNKELGAETCSKATPQAPTGLGPAGYDQGERVDAVDLWEGLRGSDAQSRIRRLTEFLGGFNGAYLETRCTPAGDLAAILKIRGGA